MREKQINESKQLAKLMIDTRLNFNNSFVEVDGMVEKYITAIHQLQDKLIKDTTTPKLKQVQAVEKEFDAIKDKWLGKMKSTISNAVHAFKTNYATLQTAEFQSEQTIKTGNSKTAGLTAKQRKKLATSMSKKQIWDNAVTMATEMIRRVNLTSSTDFLKIDLDDFLAAYHDRVEDVQHMTEASSKACAQLIEAYRVETAFLESVDKLVHDAEAKIKFEVGG